MARTDVPDTLDVFDPKDHDLGGGFRVRRLLPQARRQAIGPFLFFDHFGPVELGVGRAHEVRPHPHIGLATVTYLFEGAMLHRDSTGAVQRIEPGAVNWMTAGRGIVHSERTPEDLQDQPRRLHGLQLWAALPVADEECEPGFQHVAALDIPFLRVGDGDVRVLVGEALGLRSPVQTRSPTLYLDLELPAGGELELPGLGRDAGGATIPGFELGIYAVNTDLSVNGAPLAAQHLAGLAGLAGDATLRVAAGQPARAVVIGGQALGHRHLQWNFVASRRERLLQAREDWAQQRFPLVPGDEDEFIPLPSS